MSYVSEPKKAIYLNKLDLLLSTCHFLWFNALDIVKIGMLQFHYHCHMWQWN